MKKFLVWCFVMVLLTGLAHAKKAKDDVKSTEGVKIDASITKTIKQESKAEKKEFSQLKKAKKTYVKNVNKIKNLREHKRIKERDLEFYNSRLQIQQNRLQELEEKGEEK